MAISPPGVFPARGRSLGWQYLKKRPSTEAEVRTEEGYAVILAVTCSMRAADFRAMISWCILIGSMSSLLVKRVVEAF